MYKIDKLNIVKRVVILDGLNVRKMSSPKLDR